MSPTDTVLDFIAAWNRVDHARIYALMSDDIVYHNIPMEPLVGLDAVKAWMTATPVEDAEWITHHIAANGPVVLTERTDRLKMRGAWITVRVMGAFEVHDGKITAWRDYFDLAEVRP